VRIVGLGVLTLMLCVVGVFGWLETGKIESMLRDFGQRTGVAERAGGEHDAAAAQ
jgi:hypothetical protein